MLVIYILIGVVFGGVLYIYAINYDKNKTYKIKDLIVFAVLSLLFGLFWPLIVVSSLIKSIQNLGGK